MVIGSHGAIVQIGKSKNAAKSGSQIPITALYTGWANKKRGTLLLSISLPIIDRFSQFFLWHTLWTICNNVIIICFTTR